MKQCRCISSILHHPFPTSLITLFNFYLLCHVLSQTLSPCNVPHLKKINSSQQCPDIILTPSAASLCKINPTLQFSFHSLAKQCNWVCSVEFILHLLHLFTFTTGHTPSATVAFKQIWKHFTSFCVGVWLGLGTKMYLGSRNVRWCLDSSRKSVVLDLLYMLSVVR